MKDEKLESLVKQAIEKTIAHLETAEPRIEHTVYSDDSYSGCQVGFYLYYDYGRKDYRISPSVLNEEGFAARCGRYDKKELCLDSDFVSVLIDDYIHLMREADISEREYDNRGLWEEEKAPFTSPVSIQESFWVAPLPFECEVTDELYEFLEIDRRYMIDVVRKIVNHCKKEREHYIFMHTHCWWAVECILTCVLGYEIGVRIRYDAQMGGGFCPICRDEDGTYWQMETYSYLHLPEDTEFVERLSDYYVFLLALQRGLVSTDKPIEKFSEEKVAYPYLSGLLRRGIIFI
ncbi:MAG: hypothetical protein E7097_04035 [Bacteroides sp.]|nr:hypothetical protein [Bacteroides sp.]